MSAAAVIAIRRKRLIRRFREAGALDPEHAVELESIRERPSWIFRQMQRGGVFQHVANGRFYMNEAKAVEFLQVRQRRALIMAAILVLVFVTLWMCGVIGK